MKSRDKKLEKYVLLASIIATWSALLSNLRNKDTCENRFSHIRIRYNDDEIKLNLLD